MRWSSFLLLPLGVQSALAKCKCTPTDKCWPSASTWNTLNSTVHGKLIHNQPIAEPCYPGDAYNAQSCKSISEEWTNSSALILDPIGYSYPMLTTCPPVNSSVVEYPTCDLGIAPVYTINATAAEDVVAGIKFAKENNIRLVIKNTGHDIVGRSQGYGSLMIWIKYIQDGINYHETYSGKCQSNWTGSAFTVGGGYIWNDVYNAAADHGRIVVGGDDRTVGVIGGYLQGAGHGPASHEFGLGTDQVLEMTVVLASGEIVTANACQNTNLFTALRGGGGGTFGVVISTTIKAYRTRPILAQTLTVIPLNTSVSPLLNVTANIMSKYPLLSDTGFSGIANIGPSIMFGLPAKVPGAYSHTFAKLLPINASNSTIQQAKATVNKHLVQEILRYNGTQVLIKSSWSEYPTFQDYFTSSKHMASVGTSHVQIGSRFFDKPSLQNNAQKLEAMLRTIFSSYDNRETPSADYQIAELVLIGGGKVLQPKPHTSVNPAWRKTYLLSEIITTWPENASSDEVQKINDDATFRKTQAMKALTPGTGTYLNEADRNDPAWKEDFWGQNYGWLKSVKERYDPGNVFWCFPCVGNEGWAEDKGRVGYGPLCETN